MWWFPANSISHVVCSFLFLALHAAADFDDGLFQLKIEHSFDQGQSFRERAYVSLSTVGVQRDGGALRGQLSDQSALTAHEASDLEELARNNGFYQIRASDRLTGSSENYVFSSVPAHMLVQAGLSDILHVSLDTSKNAVLSVAVYPAGGYQGVDGTVGGANPHDSFNTTLRLTDVLEGPAPDTQTYLAKMEKEKRDKEQGQGQDNRSFFAKYWMYIVPVIIFLILSGSAAPDGQQGAR